MKKLKDVDFTKYTTEQLEAINEVFSELTADIPKIDLERNVSEFAAWETEEMELDRIVDLSNAERQAREFAKKRNAGKQTAQDILTDNDKEISKSVLDWLTKRKKRGHGKAH